MSNDDESEFRLLCAQRGLTPHESDAAIAFLQGRAACPIKNYSNQIRQAVAVISDIIRERNGELRGNIEHAHY
jgi:hypothetical protein